MVSLPQITRVFQVLIQENNFMSGQIAEMTPLETSWSPTILVNLVNNTMKDCGGGKERNMNLNAIMLHTATAAAHTFYYSCLHAAVVAAEVVRVIWCQRSTKPHLNAHKSWRALRNIRWHEPTPHHNAATYVLLSAAAILWLDRVYHTSNKTTPHCLYIISQFHRLI